MPFASPGLLRFAAFGLALVGVINVVVFVPRLLGLDRVSWWVTVLVGVVLGVAVVISGYAKRASDETHTERADG